MTAVAEWEVGNGVTRIRLRPILGELMKTRRNLDISKIHLPRPRLITPRKAERRLCAVGGIFIGRLTQIAHEFGLRVQHLHSSSDQIARQFQESYGLRSYERGVFPVRAVTTYRGRSGPLQLGSGDIPASNRSSLSSVWCQHGGFGMRQVWGNQ